MTKKKNKRISNDLQNTTQKTLKIEQHEPHFKLGVNSCAPEEGAVPTPLVTPVMSLIFSIGHEEN